MLADGLTDPQRLHELLLPHLEALAEEGETVMRLRTLQERLATVEQKAAEVLLLDTSTALAREHVTKLLAQLDRERVALQQEEAALQLRGEGEGEVLSTSGTLLLQQLRQWLLGTTLAEAGYENNGAGPEAAAGKTSALTAPLPAELQAVLFQIRRHIVRELIAAVYVGADGRGVIVLREDNRRLLVQVRALPPKMTARSLKKKLKSG